MLEIFFHLATGFRIIKLKEKKYWLPVVKHGSKPRDNALDAFCGLETI